MNFVNHQSLYKVESTEIKKQKIPSLALKKGLKITQITY